MQCTLSAAALVLTALPAAAQLGPPVANVDLGGFTTGSLTNVHAKLVSDITGRRALTQMATAPGFGDSVFFAERSGAIYQVDLTNPNPATNFSMVGDVAAALGAQFGDGRASDQNAGDGMRGIAFHPYFSAAGSAGYGKLYTVHEEAFNSGSATFPAPAAGDPGGQQDGVLTEWTYNFNNGTLLNNPREVLRAQIIDGHHPMQQIAFNPASQPGDADFGNLYIALGDGGVNVTSRNGFDPDPNNIVQALDNVHGKILRINPNASGVGYSVPTGPGGNVFANDADPGTLGEIYAYGFRNPQTIGFDRNTGAMFVGDIGQLDVEEINRVENGGNYGWADREGTFVDGVDSGSGVVYDGFFQEVLPATRDADPYTYPVLQFSQVRDGAGTGANAIVGGYVYDGNLAQELTGLYLFGNLSTDDIFYADADDLANDNDPAAFNQLQLVDDLGNPIALSTLVGSNRTLMRFGQDTDGEIYIFSQRTGQLFRLEGTAGELGDLDSDGDIDADDLAIATANFTGSNATTSVSLAEGDLDRDGDIDNKDLGFILGQFTSPLLTASGDESTLAVPEPSSLIVLAGAGLLLVRRRNRA